MIMCPRGKGNLKGLPGLMNCSGLEVTNVPFCSQFIGQNMSCGSTQSPGVQEAQPYWKGRGSEVFAEWHLPFTELLWRARLGAERSSDRSFNFLNNPWKRGLLSSANTWITWRSEVGSTLFKAAQWWSSRVRVASQVSVLPKRAGQVHRWLEN